MAVKSPVIILLDHATWQLARLTKHCIEMTACVELEWSRLDAIASEIKAALDTWKVKKRRVVVGLSSTLCVCSLLRLPSQKQARQRQAMSYLLEPYLPWPAENFVADFETSRTDAFAVAVPVEPLSGLIQQLEELGIRVESIAPLARLALQQDFKAIAGRDTRIVVVWGDERTMDIWLVEARRPVLWRAVDPESATIVRELKQIALDESKPLPLVMLGLNEEIRQAIFSLPDFQCRTIEKSSPTTKLEAALRSAAAIMTGSEVSAIELRRDGLTYQDRNRSIGFSFRAVQLSVLGLLVAIGTMLYHVGNQLDQQRKLAGDKQAELFRRLFPDSPVPVGVRTRLESEHAKLMGMRGEVVELPDLPSAVDLIERLLRSLPPDLRYRILEVRVEQGRLYLVGQVREHGDADRIAEQLRRANLTVESPSTHRLPQKGVEFRISAQCPVSPSPTKEVKS